MAPVSSTEQNEEQEPLVHDYNNSQSMSSSSRIASPATQSFSTPIKAISAPNHTSHRLDPELARYAASSSDDSVVASISDEENTRLRRLIDSRILVVMVVTYFLQTLDKGTLSFASIMHFREDLHLAGQQYNWLSTAIYLAILVVEYPTNLLIQRLPLGKYLGISIILWAIALAAHAGCRNYREILVARIALGVFEAVCQPAFICMSAMWYQRDEQPRIVAFWFMMNGAQQIVGGLLAYCFSLIKDDGPLKSWQALFFTYGVISVLWGVFVLYWLPDSPMRAHCYSEKDKKLMILRVRGNKTGIQNRTWRSEQVIEALKDPKSWCFCLIGITTTLPNSGLTSFANIVIKSLNFTILQTQLLAMVIGAVLIIVLFSSTYLADRYHQTTLVMAVYIFPSITGTIVLMTVVNHNKATQVGLLIGYYITTSFWAASTLVMTLITRNVAGQSKKMVLTAMYFISWAIGNSIGPQVFLSWDSPRYFIAFSTHLACYAVLLATILFLRFYLKRQNTLKERQHGSLNEVDASDQSEGLADYTDKEQKHFRYVY